MWIRLPLYGLSHRIPVSRPTHPFHQIRVLYHKPLDFMDNAIQHQFYDYNTLLVINSQGVIRQLYTPIKVQCIDAVENIRNGISVYIDEIRTTRKDELIYLINGKEYTYTHFAIQIGF
jgi:hypothetical protein